MMGGSDKWPTIYMIQKKRNQGGRNRPDLSGEVPERKEGAGQDWEKLRRGEHSWYDKQHK